MEHDPKIEQCTREKIEEWVEIGEDDLDCDQIIAALNAERCPDCQERELIRGRRRGISKRLSRAACGSTFEVAPFHFDQPPHQFLSVRRVGSD